MLLTLTGQKEEYINLKEEVAETPLEKSINNILETINQYIDKIVKLNQIEWIY